MFQDIASVDVVDTVTVTVTTKRPWVGVPVVPVGQQPRRDHGPRPSSTRTTATTTSSAPARSSRTSWKVNDNFVAKKNPNYWAKDADGNQLPYLDKITFMPLEDGRARLNSLEAGDFQVMHTSEPQQIEEIREEGRRRLAEQLESDKFTEVGYIMLNAANPPFNNLTARQVLAYGIDRRRSTRSAATTS